MAILKLVGTCKNKGRDIVVLRDQDGKFYVKNDKITTQKRLNATEIVCWLLHALNDEI